VLASPAKRALRHPSTDARSGRRAGAQVQTAASRRMEQSASTLADGHFAAGMDDKEHSGGRRAAAAPASKQQRTAGALTIASRPWVTGTAGFDGTRREARGGPAPSTVGEAVAGRRGRAPGNVAQHDREPRADREAGAPGVPDAVLDVDDPVAVEAPIRGALPVARALLCDREVEPDPPTRLPAGQLRRVLLSCRRPARVRTIGEQRRIRDRVALAERDPGRERRAAASRPC
jgi:hypothetical protein